MHEYFFLILSYIRLTVIKELRRVSLNETQKGVTMSQITVTIDKRVGIIFKSQFGACTLSHDIEFIDVPCSPESPEGYEERPYMLISGLDVSPEHRRQGHLREKHF